MKAGRTVKQAVLLRSEVSSESGVFSVGIVYWLFRKESLLIERHKVASLNKYGLMNKFLTLEALKQHNFNSKKPKFSPKISLLTDFFVKKFEIK